MHFQKQLITSNCAKIQTTPVFVRRRRIRRVEKKYPKKKKNENSIIITPNYRMFLTHPVSSAIFLTQSSHSSLTHTVISLTHSFTLCHICLFVFLSVSLTDIPFHFPLFFISVSLSIYPHPLSPCFPLPCLFPSSSLFFFTLSLSPRSLTKEDKQQ